MKKGFWDIFNESIKEYGAKFKPVLKSWLFLYLIPVLALFVIIAILVFSFFKDLNIDVMALSTMSSEQVDEYIVSIISTAPSGLIAGFLMVFLVTILAFLLIYFLFFLCLLNIGISNKPTFKEAFKSTREGFLRYLGFVIVTSLFLFGLFLLFIIPGIIFIIYWLFAMYIFVYEKKGIIDSLKSSYNIVKGKWWFTFGYSVLIITVYSIASLIISFIPLIGGIVTFLVLMPILLFFFKNFYLGMKGDKRK